MEGRFDDAEKFISPLEQRDEGNFEKVLSFVRKQKFLEAIENSTDPNLDELVALLNDLESLCEREDFNKLCYCLSLGKINEHPDFSD